MKKLNTILLCLHGSHLYGTDTPNSDKDYKGIYKAPVEDVILGIDQETIIYNTKAASDRRRNTKDDIDYQYKELRRFIKDALTGQIYAIDLLFSPKEMWLEHNEVWLDIIEHRSKLLSSNVKPFIGYATQQAAKYGLKGSRLGEVIRFRDWLKTHPSDTKVGEVFEKFEVSEHIRQVEQQDKVGNTVYYIRVLEKHYQLNQKIGNLAHSLSLWIDKYGARSVDAMENRGVDFKAVSHAFRCVYQIKELLTTGHLEMPLKEAKFLREIKEGKHTYPYLQGLLADELDELRELKSVLPAEPDREFWDAKLVSYYLDHHAD
jgi:predicted nucleotidyltransferase